MSFNKLLNDILLILDIPAQRKHTHVIKTILPKGPLKGVIEVLVQATSELEALTSAVYTHVFWKAVENASETDSCVPAKLFDQGFVSACFQAVAKSKEEEQKYKPDPDLASILNASRQLVPEVDFNYKSFGQLLNQCAKRMLTGIKTNISLHMLKRQGKVVKNFLTSSFPRMSKSQMGYTIKLIQSSINDSEPFNAYLYKDKDQINEDDLGANDDVQRFITEHRGVLNMAALMANVTIKATPSTAT